MLVSTGRILATASTEGDSTTPRDQILLSQPPMQNPLSTENSSNWVSDWWPFHTNIVAFSLQAAFQLTTELSHSPTGYFTSLQATELLPTSANKWLVVKVKVTLRLSVYLQIVCLVVKSLETHEQRYFHQLNPCASSPYVTSSLTRRCVCLLWIYLAFLQMYISHVIE
jgi:hypothetical protein